MILTFLLCFLSLIFSIYCIGIQQANAASKPDSNLCNPLVNPEMADNLQKALNEYNQKMKGKGFKAKLHEGYRSDERAKELVKKEQAQKMG